MKALQSLIKLLEKIDVVMCTYNSNAPHFDAVLRGISEEVPVHCFILIDRFSADGTVNKVLEVFPKAKVILSEENLGKARKKGIDNVDTSLFAFIDDDVLVLKGWYNYARRTLNDGIGAVASFAKSCGKLNRGIHYNVIRPHVVISSRNNIESQRGWTFATLIKKEAVAAWKPEEVVAAGEDHEILRHVVRNGFLWVTSYFVFAEHFDPVQSYFAFYRNIWRKGAWNAAGLRHIKLVNLHPYKLISQTISKFLIGIKISFMFRNAFVIPYYFVDSFAFFYGYVCWKKKLFLHR